MRIAIVTDAWSPQVNGVVNTLKATSRQLRSTGHSVLMVTPENMMTFSCPTYPEIKLALKPYARVVEQLEEFDPDCIHIATEGPLGLAARRYCLNNGLDFTTAYHTRFPEYLKARFHLPLAISYRWLNWFHGAAKAVMVPTPGVQVALEKTVSRTLCNGAAASMSIISSPAGARKKSRCVVRCIYMSAGSRWKRTSRLSCRWNCQVRNG
jgi:hypothetical protein